jgi:hypothetical protein
VTDDRIWERQDGAPDQRLFAFYRNHSKDAFDIDSEDFSLNRPVDRPCAPPELLELRSRYEATLLRGHPNCSSHFHTYTVRVQQTSVNILVLGAVPSAGGLWNPGFAVPLASDAKPDRKWT